MKNVYKNAYLLLLISLFSLTTAHAHWTTKGPYGGRVKCLWASDSLMYVGTYNGGVYRSTSSAVTSWRYANYTGLTEATINAITSIGNYVIAGTPSGIFLSNDVGTTWASKNSGLTTVTVLSLLTADDHVIAGTAGGGIFLSHDSGRTWVVSNSGLTNLTVTGMAYDGTAIYAATSGGGVFISTDDGDTWSAINTGLSVLNITAITVSSGNIFVGTSNGVYATNSSSITWGAVNSGLGNLSINGLSASGGVIYAATNAGVYASSGSVPSWTGIPGYGDTVNTVAVLNGKLVAGTRHDGLYSGTTSSMSIKELNTGFNNLETYTLYNSDQLVITATNKGLFVSRDLAATYTRSNSGLTDSLHISCMAFAGSKLYVGTLFGGVFESNDTGIMWTAVNTGLTVLGIKKIAATNTGLVAASTTEVIFNTGLSTISWSAMTGGPSGANVTALVSDGSNAYMAVYGSGVYVSLSGGAWTAVNTGLSNTNVTALAIKDNSLFVATNGGGVFSASLSSPTWTAVNSGLPTTTITSLCVAGKWLAAGYKGGVHITTDGGATWNPPNILLYIPAYADVTALSFTTASTRIFAGTPNNSLYSNSVSELPTGIAPVKANAGTFGITPNPNNGSFTLSLEGLKAEAGEISVYDNLGRLVYVAANAYETAKNGLNLKISGGIYFVKVQTPLGAATQKLVIE